MGINQVTWKQKFLTLTRHPGSFLTLIVTILAAVITIGSLGFLICYILINGIPNLKPELFAWMYNSDNVSMMPAIINTLLMVLLTLLVAVPLGVFAAIYLVEYAKSGNKLVKIVRVTAETLTGIPSIVYGLFGMLFFELGIFPVIRFAHAGNHGIAGNYENDGRGVNGSAEIFSRRKFRLRGR